MLSKVTIVHLFILHVIRETYSTNFILHGQPASPGQFPYQVSLRLVNVNMRHLCGGAILNKHWIVTAAHCIRGYVPQDMKIVAGTIYKEPIDIILDAVEFKQPRSDWNRNDIALIRVRQEIRYNSYVQPIKISDDTLRAGMRAVVSGWGYTEKGSATDHLMYLNIKLIPREDCQRQYPPSISIGPTQICSFSAYGRGMCFGDSGGPMTVNGKLVGVASFVHGRGCGKGYPDVCTRVPYYRNWIESMIRRPYDQNDEEQNVTEKSNQTTFDNF